MGDGICFAGGTIGDEGGTGSLPRIPCLFQPIGNCFREHHTLPKGRGCGVCQTPEWGGVPRAGLSQGYEPWLQCLCMHGFPGLRPAHLAGVPRSGVFTRSHGSKEPRNQRTGRGLRDKPHPDRGGYMGRAEGPSRDRLGTLVVESRIIPHFVPNREEFWLACDEPTYLCPLRSRHSGRVRLP